MERIIICIIAIILILTLIVSSYWWHKNFPLSDHENIIYIMRLPNEYWLISIVSIIFYSLFLLLSFIFLEEGGIYVFLTFYFFELASIYLCISVLLWKCAIKNDSLTFYTPLLPVKEIKFHEITSVKIAEIRGNGKKRLEGYNQRKKIFSVYENTKGFDLLCDYFNQNGKIERIPVKENFSVTAQKSEIIPAVIMSICFSFLFIIMILKRNELELFYQIAFSFLTLLSLSRAFHMLLWKVTMDFHSISIRNSLGIVKSYEIRQITKIIEQEYHIILYADKNKIAKIPKDSKNFQYLMARFHRSGIEMQ